MKITQFSNKMRTIFIAAVVAIFFCQAVMGANPKTAEEKCDGSKKSCSKKGKKECTKDNSEKNQSS